jgi:hypothetical protein
MDAIGLRELQVYQDNVDRSRDAQSEEVLVAVADTNDVQVFVLTEKAS